MKIAKKVLSVILTVVVLACTLAVPVSAESIYDTAVDLPSGEEQSFTLGRDGDCMDFKVTLSQKGTLKFNINSGMSAVRMYVYDSNGNKITVNEYDFAAGSGNTYDDALCCDWNEITENSKCTAKYELYSGIYYIRFKRYYNSGSGKLAFTATYDSEDASSAKISYITFELEVGETLRLGTVVDPTDAEITWTSSRSRVAEVSESGMVTAKKAGSAIISAKCGKSVKRVKIIVV